MSYEWNFRVIWDYRDVFATALVTTLELAFIVLVAGSIIGLLLALARTSKNRVLSGIALVYTELMRAIPPLILLVWAYYCLPLLFGVRFSAFVTTCLAFALQHAAFTAEVFRTGIESIPKGQLDAAKLLGLSDFHVKTRILIPQAFLTVMPSFVNETISTLKYVSLGSVIGVYELLHSGTNLISITYRPLEIYTTIAVLYLLLILPLAWLSYKLEFKKFLSRR